MSNQIQIKVDGPKVTPDRFEKAVREFFSLVEGVAKNMSETAKPDDWIVEVSAGSAIIRLKSQNPERDSTTDAVASGLRSLNSGVQSVPRWFSKDEVRSARILAALVDDDRKFVTDVAVQNGEAPISLSQEIVKTADAILSGEKHLAFGSIEGFIESLHRKEGQPFTCSIHDPIHRRSVVCSFTNLESEETAYKAFRPPKRILASGLIHYAKEGYPARIDVNFVREFPDESDLPSSEEIRAYWKS